MPTDRQHKLRLLAAAQKGNWQGVTLSTIEIYTPDPFRYDDGSDSATTQPTDPHGAHAGKPRQTRRSALWPSRLPATRRSHLISRRPGTRRRTTRPSPRNRLTQRVALAGPPLQRRPRHLPKEGQRVVNRLTSPLILGMSSLSLHLATELDRAHNTRTANPGPGAAAGRPPRSATSAHPNGISD